MIANHLEYGAVKILYPVAPGALKKQGFSVLNAGEVLPGAIIHLILGGM